jgi:RNA polymerase sigma factor FliA
MQQETILMKETLLQTEPNGETCHLNNHSRQPSASHPSDHSWKLPEAEEAEESLGEKLRKYAPMVRIIVARMRHKLPSHADLEELESIGVIGLLNAIERYDPSRGYSFQTYASIRIRGAILDELRAMDMIPRSVRLKQRKLQRAVETLEQDLQRTPSDQEIREALELDSRQYSRLKAQTLPLNFIFLDRPRMPGEPVPHETIADESQKSCPERLETAELQQLVAQKILELPDAQKKVLALYFYEELRLAEIGKIMGVSEARVSQIRTQALLSLRKFVQRITGELAT